MQAVEPKPSQKEHVIKTGDARGFLRRRRAWVVGIAALCLLLVAFGVGLYRYRWEGPAVSVVTKVVPYPAAIVDGRIVRYAEFEEDLNLLRDFYEEEKGRAPAGSRFPGEEELRGRVLDRLIKDQLAMIAAGRYGIVVTSDDVRHAYETTIIDQSAIDAPGGRARAEARAEETLRDRYDLRASEFKARVLHPYLIRRKLEGVLAADEELNEAKLRKINDALAELKAGKEFREVAASYSEDSASAANGGERGSIGRGLLPPEVEAQAFALKPGETSGVIRSALGYHVIRVLAKTGNGAAEKVSLQEIFVNPIRLDDYLEAQKKTSNIVIFVR